MQVPIFVELETYRTLLEYLGAKMWDIASWIERAKKSWEESWMKFWLEKAKMLDIESWTKSWVTRWLALLATVVGIVFQVYTATQEERQIWYWTILTTPAPGNSGKKEALEHLASHGTPLPSIDLSCHAMGGGETKDGECERPVYLEDLDLSKKTLGEEANLIRANLSDANLRRADLSGAKLRSANLSGADLSGADLRRAKLSYANLSDAELSYANLSDAELRSAKLSDAKLSDADLSGANLRSADLSDADLRRADLSGADLRRADLRRANLSNAKLIDADLSNANLSNANLSNANLSDANLSGADLSDANLSDADFNNATFSSDKTFTNAWAWADEQPRNLPEKIDIQLCKYNKGSSRDLRPDSCIRRIPSKRDNQQSHSVRPTAASQRSLYACVNWPKSTAS